MRNLRFIKKNGFFQSKIAELLELRCDRNTDSQMQLKA